jgi:protein TonB
MTADENQPSEEMTAARERAKPARGGSGLRWTLCIGFAIAFHAAAFAALLAPWPPESDDIDGAPAILVELAQVTAAPGKQPTEVATGPQRPDVQAAPDNSAKPAEPQPTEHPPVIAAATANDPIPVATEQVEPTKRPTPERAQPPRPSDNTEARKRVASRASVASAPSAAAQQARASAPAPGANLRDDTAAPNWKSQLLAVLERNKRYPSDAQSNGDQGVAMLAFAVDRQGGVHRAHIARSSGSAALDRETLSLLQRAQPLPAPPAEMRGAQIAVMVPIRYSIR